MATKKDHTERRALAIKSKSIKEKGRGLVPSATHGIRDVEYGLYLTALDPDGDPYVRQALAMSTDKRFTDFLEANSQSHIEMNSVLGVQGVDLQDVDPRNENQLIAWINLHFLEHQTAEIKLGI